MDQSAAAGDTPRQNIDTGPDGENDGQDNWPGPDEVHFRLLVLKNILQQLAGFVKTLRLPIPLTNTDKNSYQIAEGLWNNRHVPPGTAAERQAAASHLLGARFRSH